MDIHVTDNRIQAVTKAQNDYREQGLAHVRDGDGRRRDIEVKPWVEIMRDINTSPPEPTGSVLGRRMAEARRILAPLYEQLVAHQAGCTDSDDIGQREIVFRGENTGVKVHKDLAKQLGVNPDNHIAGDVI